MFSLKTFFFYARFNQRKFNWIIQSTVRNIFIIVYNRVSKICCYTISLGDRLEKTPLSLIWNISIVVCSFSANYSIFERVYTGFYYKPWKYLTFSENVFIVNMLETVLNLTKLDPKGEQNRWRAVAKVAKIS